MTIDAREERRRNVKALAMAAAIIVLVGAFAYRPATVVGIDGDALAHSIGGGNLVGSSTCVEVGESRWRCKILAGSDGSTYIVQTRDFGCWDAVREARLGEQDLQHRDSGCINAIDIVSPL